MFAPIALFELKYQLKNPVFWVVSVLFFLMTFGAVTVDEIQMGSGGNVHVNSPAAITQIHLILSVFFMFVTTAFVANVVVRDDESGFGPMVRATRVSKFNYLIARFTGAFATAALAFGCVPLAIFVGTLMPWLDPETIGPNRIEYYAQAWAFLALPNIFLTSAIFFAVATVTRSMMGSYVGVVVFLVAYLVTNGIVGSKPEYREIMAWAEPFGLAASAVATQYWTAAESNSQMVALEGALLGNRLLMIGLGLVALAFALWRFSFTQKALSSRAAARADAKLAKAAAVPPTLVQSLPPTRPAAAGSARLWSRIRFEMVQLFRSPAFFVLMIVGLFNAGGALWFFGELYGTPSRPATFALIDQLRGSFGIIPIIIAIYYAGELVWRDRQVKFHEIIDATSLPNWAYLVPKVLGLSAVLLCVLLISVVAAVLLQLLRGFDAIALGQYILWYALPFTVEMLLLAVLAVFVQALSPNKYVGWALMTVYLVAGIVLSQMGFEHPLYLYGETPRVQFSDMNADRLGGAAAWWLRLYWAGWALLLSVLAHLLWRRGNDVSLKPRLARLPGRLRGVPLLLVGAGLAGSAATGSYIYTNTNVLNEYRNRDDGEIWLADLEREYLRYERLPQPRVTNVVVTVDLKPGQRRFDATGRYTLVNDTGAPVQSLHVILGDRDTRIMKLAVPGARVERDDKRFNYTILRFATPLAPGATTTLDFVTQRWHRGFPARGQDRTLIENGTFLNNFDFAPVIGFNRQGLLTDRITRRKRGLSGELRAPKLGDAWGQRRNDLSNAPWVTSDITVITDADQTAIAPGDKLADTVSGGRRTARFVSKTPILAFFSVQSARYAEAKGEATLADGRRIPLSVFHHPDHGWNTARMISAMQKSLAYFTRNFGPYQFNHARIIEFPAYAEFAQAFAGTVPYSEGIGFLANAAEPDKIDYVTYITAHELGHQYWGHQIVPADTQGANFVTETMAQYSALMVMKQLYGPDKMRRFLKYELDNYLRNRGNEAIEELPLVKVENQGYIHYRKGSVVLYLLQDRLGEDRVNAMLADLFRRYRFSGPPFMSPQVLADGFKGLARNDQERELVSDLLERITVFDLKATGATTRQLPDGRWETRLVVDAAKYHADGKGVETAAPLADSIDVGLFTAKPGQGAFDARNVLAMTRLPVTSGKQTLVLISKVKPTVAGIDPYAKYVDRNADDNLVDVN
ncbi:aminopeptidase [Sandarakinorhabdus cyanobacteriorum]|uniref:Aminopeptidase n=1 Tax=Sandarakinorhabdus cyanobacteriorum TaxID=1981098 RepID=A0A255Y314_9SPHN|nr:M1 family aminopeptidase [Sandarakinorhabdus cyanobacteriorum]OYQ23657.1 aminopeptidase [Sandarakinorhabdus cyanobacteriorum]